MLPSHLQSQQGTLFQVLELAQFLEITASRIKGRWASAIWSGGMPRPEARLVPLSARANVSLRPEQLTRGKE